jgi:NAD(P)H-flavin reductase
MLLTYKTLLSKKTQLTADVCLFHFNLFEPKEIKFNPGQYIVLKVPSDKGPISRLYSIASSNTVKNSFELIVEIVPSGLASNYLFNLKENNEIIFQGPAGAFGLKENKKEKIFMVTGTGIAPILSIIKSNFPQSKAGFNFQLFWGLKTHKDVYLFDELKKFNLKICLSREQNLEMIPEIDKKFFGLGHIDSYSPLLTTADYYLCGRRETTESLRLFLINKGVLPENIIFEKF